MTFINDSGWCLFFVSHHVCGHWKVAFKLNDYFKRWFQSRSFSVGSSISASSRTRIELQVNVKEKTSCRFWYLHDSHLITLWRWSVLVTKDSQMTLFFSFFWSVDSLRCHPEDQQPDTEVVPPDPTLRTLVYDLTSVHTNEKCLSTIDQYRNAILNVTCFFFSF